MKPYCKFSSDRRYRYLWRSRTAVLTHTGSMVAFVLLNPSTADEFRTDPTVSRCLTRGARLGFEEIAIVNIFAMRSTDPKILYSSADPIGPDNDASILSAAGDASMVICGWGQHGNFQERGKKVLQLLRCAGHQPHALKVNADGTPAHLLYLPYSLEPKRMELGE